MISKRFYNFFKFKLIYFNKFTLKSNLERIKI